MLENRDTYNTIIDASFKIALSKFSDNPKAQIPRPMIVR